jgi:hypothetical protein
VYTALRLMIFGAAFGLLYAIGLEWWLAGVVAAVIGLCISYLTLRPLQMRVAESLAAARANPRVSSDDEDAVASEDDRRGEA